MEPTPWTVKAWRRQRQATWVSIRYWLIALLLGAIGFNIPFWRNSEHVHHDGNRYTLSLNDETEGEFTLQLVSFVVTGGAFIAILFAMRRHYRCPKCGEIPMAKSGFRWSLSLYPAVCPNCRAPLR